jgi:hypothetical protein
MLQRYEKMKEIKKEAKLTLNQRVYNNHNSLLAFIALDNLEFSRQIQKQVYGSTGCGSSLKIDDKNNMCKQYSCKKRFCISCLRNIAFERDMYLYPSVRKIAEEKEADPKNKAGLWFVTLTVPTCEAKDLPDRIKELQRVFRIMYKEMKKEKKKSYLNGIRKLEINPNLKEGISVKESKDYNDYMYHAHFHLLVQGTGNAYEIRRRWLNLYPNAKLAAQNVRVFDHSRGTLVELLKYISKPAVSGDAKIPEKWKAVSAPVGNKNYVKDSTWTNPARCSAFIYIYQCLMGCRTIFTYGSIKKSGKYFGFITKDQEDKTKVTALMSDEYFSSILSLEREEEELKKQEKSKVRDYKLDQLRIQKEKIIAFIEREENKASRRLENTVWLYDKGHYIDDLTGEQLCSEEEVEEADQSKDKSKYFLTKMFLDNQPSKKTRSKKKTTAELVEEKRQELLDKKKSEKRYKECSSLRGEDITDIGGKALLSRKEFLSQPYDHRKLYFRNYEAYKMFLYREEKEKVMLGLAPPLGETKDEFLAYVKRGLRSQKQFVDKKDLKKYELLVKGVSLEPRLVSNGWIEAREKKKEI